MTNSRSTTSRSRSSSWLVAIAALVLLASTAYAGGRKRIVVLDFEGPKADKFHADLVRLVKKSHTVIATDKWNGAAEELDAAKVTEKNIKKIAKKLKIDGVITGKVEKRRDEYILRLRLRAGTSGELVGNTIDTKADGPRLAGKAQRELKDELIAAIDDLEGNHGGGGDDDDADKPAKKQKASDDDDDADKPAKKKKASADDDDGDKPKKGGFAKHDDDARGGDKVGDSRKRPTADDDEDAKPKKVAKKDDDEDAKPKKTAKKNDDTSAALATKHDDDESPVPKKKTRKTDDDDGGADSPKPKKVAKSEDDDDDGSSVEAKSARGGETVDSALALSPGHRAIDAMVGLSFTARKLSFDSAATLAQKPPSYNQGVPVAGAMFDLTVYPLAFNHDKTGPQTGLGLHVMYDRVIKINSQKQYIDGTGATQTADLQTTEDRFTLGALYRYPLGKGADAPVVGGGLAYSHQQFGVQQSLPNGMSTDIPNVSYSIIEPSGFFKYVVAPKITLDVDAGFLLVTGAGPITTDAQYGGATVTGLEAAVGGDYALAKNLFVRAAFRIEKIGLTFKGDPNSMATNRNSDPAQDVFSASDLYYGFITTIGYLY